MVGKNIDDTVSLDPAQAYGVATLLVSLGFNLLGDGLRDAGGARRR